MNSEILLLASTAASIGVIHTLLGPDHYLPFIVLGRARQWSRAKIAAVTVACGIGHVGGSIAIGTVGIGFGLAISKLEAFEGARGTLASWAVLGFGIAYLIWGLRRALTAREHVHVHAHADGMSHAHTHGHRDGHAHPHGVGSSVSMTPWVLFLIFVLGPCEPLIPLLMVPAAAHSWWAVAFVGAVFASTTIVTMLAVVFTGIAGLNLAFFKRVERFTHAFAGGAVAVCGGAMVFLGV